MSYRFPSMSTADSDRCEEQEQDRYEELYEIWMQRLLNEAYDGSAPTYAEVHKRVVRQMDDEERANRDD
jgi:hypothetical protein